MLRTLLIKLVNENKMDWDEHLLKILFYYKTTCKVATWYTPYQLVYGSHPLMPIEYILLITNTNHRKGNFVKKNNK
jgi:hypothetical protein